MRSYAVNSSQAAARIVALVLVSDGHLSHEELKAFGALQRLGLAESDLDDVVRTLTEDLMTFCSSSWSGTACLDENSLRSILDEVKDPQLRATVLEVCDAVMHADLHQSHAENGILGFARSYWQEPPALAYA